MTLRRQLLLAASVVAMLGPRAGRAQAWPAVPIKVEQARCGPVEVP